MTNRLFEIIYILLQKRNVTAGELAERFGVSTRTIYRDVDALSLAGVPIYTEKGKGGGISLMPSFVLNKSLLSEHEQNEILGALNGLSNMKASESGEVLQRLSTIFNKTATNWLKLDFSGWGHYNEQTFHHFKTAIFESRVVEFDYYNSYGEKIRRKVEPVQIWFKARAWYVKGFCLLKQDLRTFKLSRVRNIALTDDLFLERDMIASLPKLDTAGSKSYGVTLKLRIAPEMTYRVFDEFDERSVEKLDNGSYMITVTWPEDDWVYGTILSYGEYIEVLEPDHIKKIIFEKAMKISRKYL